jgi:transcriptional regulator with PAS, ATPase and Fis domain
VRPAGISRAATEALRAFSWPGNIRQLEREMTRAALFLDHGDVLDLALLHPEIARARAAPPPTTLREQLLDAERNAIRDALAASGGDVVAAAARLGIGRSTLYRRLQALELDAPC